MRKSVTTDIAVLQGWPKKKEVATAAEVAVALGLTPFQITARLKGMSQRNFVSRGDDGRWFRTDFGLEQAANPSPSVLKSSEFRKKDAAGQATSEPDDARIPLLHLTRDDWGPSEFAYREARARLPHVKRRLAEFKEKRDQHGIIVLRTELDHCRSVIRRPREGRWQVRSVKDGTHVQQVIVAPDGREYVPAEPFELAEIRIQPANDQLTPVRMRLYFTSALARRDEKVKKEVEGRTEAKKVKLQKRRQASEEAQAVISADDSGWQRLSKKERREEKFRAEAESAFWNLPQERRDLIRALRELVDSHARASSCWNGSKGHWKTQEGGTQAQG